MNHQNRSRRAPKPGATPKPEQVRRAREKAGLTQTEAGQLIYGTMRTWQDWESGARRMHPGLFELFTRKVAELPVALEPDGGWRP